MFTDQGKPRDWRLDGWSGQFRDPDTETTYRATNDRQQYRTLLRGLPVAMLAFVYVTACTQPEHDHGLWLTALMAAQALSLIVAILLILIARRSTLGANFQRGWIMLGIFAALAQSLTLALGEVGWQSVGNGLVVEFFALGLLLPGRSSLTLGLSALLAAPFFAQGVFLADFDDYATSAGLVAVAFGLCAELRRQQGRALRTAFSARERAEQAQSHLETLFNDLESDHSALRDTAERNVALMEEIDYLREDAERQTRFLRGVLDTLVQGVSVFDAEMKLSLWNRHFEDLMGLPQGFAHKGMTLEALIRSNAVRGDYGEGDVEEQVAARLQYMNRTLDQVHHFEHMVGKDRVLEIMGNPLPGGGIASTYSDITDRKRVENEMQHKALHDQLTGLNNRHGFMEALHRAILRAEEHKQSFGVALFDLDSFKAVNDSHGHPMGDKLLQRVSAIITGEVRANDCVARLGGDEFAVLFSTVRQSAEAEIPAQRIINKLTAPIEIDGVTLQVGTSIGLGFYPQHGTSAEALIQSVDAALYRAKHDGKGRLITVAA